MKCFALPITCARRLVLLGWLLAVVAGARIVDIRPRIVCTGEPIRLADLAMHPEQLAASEGQLVVAEGITWEQGQRVSLRSIAWLLQRHDSLHDVRLRGPDFLTVVRLAGPEQLRLVSAAITDALQARAPWQQWEIDVQLTEADALQIAHAGGFERVELLRLDRRAVLGNLNVEIACIGEQRREVLHLAPVVRRRVQAVVLRTSYPAGTVLTSEHLDEAEVWIDRTRDATLTSPADGLGRELSRSLAAGEMLTSHDLLAPRSASRGDQVWVTCIRGNLSVRLLAIALQPGREGEQIQLRNESSDKLFRAELTGPRQAVLRVGP